MKKEMSSFDVRSVVGEMASLEGAHMDKIFQWGAGNVLFRINTRDGKKDLFFKDKKWLFISPDRPDTPTVPTSFATFLRKYITNARIGKTRQIGFDRIAETELFKSDGEYRLVFEMFGGGNVLLLQDGKIANCLTQRTFRDRVTRPGEEYAMPKERFNPLESAPESFAETFRSSDADTVRTLATVANLGGQYAEEVVKRAGVDKKAKASDVPDADIAKMYAAMEDIANSVKTSPSPTVFKENGKIVDLAPIDLRIYDGCEKVPVSSISEAIGMLMAQNSEEETEEATDPEIERLKKRIAKQKETVDAYRVEAERLKAEADSLYTEYQKVDELLNVLSEQSAKLSWDRLTEGALKIPWVAWIDPSKNTVAVKIGMLEPELDYTKGIDGHLCQGEGAVCQGGFRPEGPGGLRGGAGQAAEGIRPQDQGPGGEGEAQQAVLVRFVQVVHNIGRQAGRRGQGHPLQRPGRQEAHEGGRRLRPCRHPRSAVRHRQGRPEGVRGGAQGGLLVRTGAVEGLDRGIARRSSLLGISGPGKQDP